MEASLSAVINTRRKVRWEKKRGQKICCHLSHLLLLMLEEIMFVCGCGGHGCTHIIYVCVRLSQCAAKDVQLYACLL